MLLLTSLLLVSAASCASDSSGPPRPGFDARYNWGYSGNGPWRLAERDFAGFLAPGRVNATGEYPLRGGKNISAPYPEDTFQSSSYGEDALAIEGWSLGISVVADVPVANSTDEKLRATNGSQYFTGVKMTLSMPESLPRLPASKNGTSSGHNVSVHESWTVCFMWWDLGYGYDDRLRNDDRSCRSVLSEQCIEDIEKAAVTKALTSGLKVPRAQCRCPSIHGIKSCKGADVLLDNGCASRSAYNASTMRQWPDGKFDLHLYGGQLREKGDMAAYRETGTLAWPVIVGWYSHNNGNISAPKTHIVGPYHKARMACPRAVNATEGSVSPSGASKAGLSIAVGLVSTMVSALWGLA